jgi:hypothetical protein
MRVMGAAMTNPANSAGPAGDGSNSLAKESKTGVTVTAGVVVVANVLLYVIGNLDPDSTGGASAGLATTVGAAILGLIAAYKKRNR